MNLDLFERYKGVTGIYWFKFGETVVYVGKANCIFSRVKGHKNRFLGYWYFEAFPINKYIQKLSYLDATCFLKLCECYYIEMLNPSENKNKGNFFQNWLRSGITNKRAHVMIDELFRVNERMLLSLSKTK